MVWLVVRLSTTVLLLAEQPDTKLLLYLSKYGDNGGHWIHL